ncbi:hypothetical protein [Paenibacillus ihbetae]|nr:hypothetical protein [Paenibacillus ihbetae]
MAYKKRLPDDSGSGVHRSQAAIIIEAAIMKDMTQKACTTLFVLDYGLRR